MVYPYRGGIKRVGAFIEVPNMHKHCASSKELKFLSFIYVDLHGGAITWGSGSRIQIILKKLFAGDGPNKDNLHVILLD